MVGKRENKILCLDIAVCSSWGRRMPKHLFKTQFAQKNGHRYCLNCGLKKSEVRVEEKFNQSNDIDTRIVDFYSDFENPVFLSKEDIKNKNYRVAI